MKANRKTSESRIGGAISQKIAAHRSVERAVSRGSDGDPAQQVGDATTERPVTPRTTRPARRQLAVVGQLDNKNRLSLPRSVREAIDVGPGDSVFLNVDDSVEGVPTVRVVKAVNPLAMMLDALAEDAVRQYHAGETRSLRDVAAEYGVDLDEPEPDDDGR